ncbi:MAG: hypothetical protein Q9165_003185 [Trypethelium subeluteriae]
MTAARPHLASAIFDNSNGNFGRPHKRRKVGTSCTALDDALAGGFSYGDGGATIIDTTGSFDVLRLNDLIRLRLRNRHYSPIQDPRETTSQKEAPPPPNGETHSNESAHLLDNISITPVFDFTGLRDAVREFSDKLTQTQNPGASPTSPQKAKTIRQDTTEIPDSEGEDEDLSTNSLEGAARPAMSRPQTQPRDGAASKGKETSRPALLLIDNLTSIIQPLIRAHYAGGHDILITFIRSLRHLARTYNACVLLLNNASPSTSTFPTPGISPTTTTTGRPTGSGYETGRTTGTQPLPSIFASNQSVPMLGAVLAGAVDVHVLISKLPRSVKDARMYYGGNGVEGGVRARGGETREGIAFVRVLEVLLDREEGLEGRWGAFVVGRDGVGIEGVERI